MATVAPFRQAAVEPVPAATQLAALSFVSGVSGVLHGRSDRFRVVLHRVLSRAGKSYLQQASPYAGMETLDHSLAGRVLPLSTGVVGFAWKNGKIARTRDLAAPELEAALPADMAHVGDKRDLADVARSYLAVPMLGPDGQSTTILYADTHTVGLFADDVLVALIASMAQGFCTVMDQMTTKPLSSIQNYELEKGAPVLEEENVYEHLQELVPAIPVPRYSSVRLLNLQTTR